MNNDLVIRFIERQCTIEEAREVLRWIEATEENKAVFCQMQAVHASIGIDHSDRTEKVSPEDVRKIMKEISRKRYRLLPYAAAVVCAVVAVLLFIISPLNERNLSEYEKVLAGIEDKKEITLTVNNDKEIELSDTSIVVTYDKKGQILINDTVAVPGEKENLLFTIHTAFLGSYSGKGCAICLWLHADG